MEIEKKLEKLKTVERELTNKEQELQDVCLCVREREKKKLSSQFFSCILFCLARETD